MFNTHCKEFAVSELTRIAKVEQANIVDFKPDEIGLCKPGIIVDS